MFFCRTFALLMDFNALMNDPTQLNYETLPELRKMVEQYPFFHQARLLYLVNLHQLRDKSFGDELRAGAAFLPSPAALFQLVEGAHYDLETSTADKQDHNIMTEDEDRTLSLIDQFLVGQPEEEKTEETEPHSVPTVAEVTSDYASFLMQDTEEDTAPLRGANLIDNFISEQEGRQRYEIPELEDDGTSLPPVQQEETALGDLYNEKIVEILIKQRQYDKALEILRTICLNNPEKSSNFATQMQLLEALVQASLTP